MKWQKAAPAGRSRTALTWIVVLFVLCGILVLASSTTSFGSIHDILVASKAQLDGMKPSPSRQETFAKHQCIRPVESLLQSSCEPYQLRGLLAADAESASSSQWRPFDPTCQPTNWMAHLQKAVDDTSTIPHAISWVQNKTIVLFGSSIDRMLVTDMCEHLGLPPAQVSQSDPAYPPTPAYFIENDPPPIGHSSTHKSGVPTMCFVPHLNFSIIAVFHYGLESKDEQVLAMLMEKKQYYPPALLHDRFDYILLPLLERLGRRADLLQFASFLWDVQFLHRRDQHADGRYPLSVNSTDVDIYGERLEEAFLRIAARLPPSVPILWRTPHSIKSSNAAFLPPHVAVALATMAESVVERVTGTQWPQQHSMAAYAKQQECYEKTGRLMGRVKPSQFGNVIQGFQHLQRDDIHPGPALNWVGANILLHELHTVATQGTMEE